MAKKPVLYGATFRGGYYDDVKIVGTTILIPSLDFTIDMAIARAYRHNRPLQPCWLGEVSSVPCHQWVNDLTIFGKTFGLLYEVVECERHKVDSFKLLEVMYLKQRQKVNTAMVVLGSYKGV